MKKYFAELIGTFIMVFCGTGAVVIDEQTHGQIGHAGISITFGLVVMAIIYSFGKTSGAHINPAVTIAFSLAGLFNRKEIFPYILFQTIGAFAATGLLKLLFPSNLHLGATLPSGSAYQSFVLEILLGFILMLVILFTSQGSHEVGTMAGLAIGATVLFEAMFAGPISGASMNPARSLAPAVISGNLSSLWIYLSAPVIGAAIGVFCWKLLR
jgi:aquaporin NIP